MQKLQPFVPYLFGSAIAVVLFFFPEARPIACGAGAILPFTVVS